MNELENLNDVVKELELLNPEMAKTLKDAIYGTAINNQILSARVDKLESKVRELINVLQITSNSLNGITNVY